MRQVIVLVFFACSGCAVRQPLHSWQLVKQDATHVLVPPDVATPDLVKRTFKTDVAVRCGPFPSAEGVIAIAGRGKRARVTVTRSTLAAQPTGWLAEWASQLEDDGCLPPGSGFQLASRVAESVPLEPSAASVLLYTDEKQSAVVDIGPHTRLRVVSPLWRDAGLGFMATGPYTITGTDRSITVTGKATDNLLGYEVAQYAVQPRSSGIGYRIAFRYTERHIQEQTERRPEPVTNYFQFPPEAAFYRIFYKSSQNDFTALVVAAPTPAVLDERTRALQARGASASCYDVQKEMCVALPKDVGMVPLIAVMVNGAEVLLTRGANVSQAIESAGAPQPNAVLPRLLVRKPWNGRPVDVAFDHADTAILKLALTGGETISWKE